MLVAGGGARNVIEFGGAFTFDSETPIASTGWAGGSAIN